MKKQLTKTAKLRIAAICLFLLWGIAGFAQVSVSNQKTDYSVKEVSFSISFTLTWTTKPHNDQIWVIADYIKVEGATTVGSWLRARVTSASATGDGSAATVTDNSGFWLNTSGNSGRADITATLSLDGNVEKCSVCGDKFNWCVIAFDYPPAAVINPAGGYELKGTPPFTVNGTKLGDNVKTFGAGTCITSLSDATNNPTFVLPAAPTVSTSNPAARCGAGALTLTATAGGGTTTAMTYTWMVGGVQHTTTSNSLPLSSVAEGSTTYSVTLTNANGCKSVVKAGTITVHGLPTITLASGSTAQTVTAGSAIAQIKYNTSNATGANISGTPTGVSGAWSSNTYTVSGMPTSGGIFNYTVTTTNSNGCTNASATGTIAVLTSITYTDCSLPILNITGVGFANNNSYTRNGITISAPVTVTTCQKETYDGGTHTTSYNADCRTNPNSDGDFFSWCIVKQYAEILCPHPWRVPTHDDYCKYSGKTDNCNGRNPDIIEGVDGWSLSGNCLPNGYINNIGVSVAAWSITQSNIGHAYSVYVSSEGLKPAGADVWNNGFTLRCVR